MVERTYKIATSYPPYSREITVKTLCQMETEPRTDSQQMEQDLSNGLRIAACAQIQSINESFGIVGPTDASLEKTAYDANVKFNRDMQARLNIAKHRCNG